MASDFTLKDPRDGSIYSVFRIGDDVWMAENLNYMFAQNSWCYNNDAKHSQKQGRLYDWQAAISAPPPGWHVPSKLEFETLLKEFEGDANFQREKFILGGWRDEYGNFYDIGRNGYFWSSTEIDSDSAWHLDLHFDGCKSGIYYGSKQYGCSVVCVKDKSKSIKPAIVRPSQKKTYDIPAVESQTPIPDNSTQDIKVFEEHTTDKRSFRKIFFVLVFVLVIVIAAIRAGSNKDANNGKSIVTSMENEIWTTSDNLALRELYSYFIKYHFFNEQTKNLKDYMSGYADSVNHNSNQKVTRENIEEEKRKFFKKWDSLSYDIDLESLNVALNSEGTRVRVRFNNSFRLLNALEGKLGTASNDWILINDTGPLRIVSENQKILKTQDILVKLSKENEDGTNRTSNNAIFRDSRDGKMYKTVRIGNQTWMSENLNYDVGEGCYCYDNNAANCEIYGKLYTWDAALKAVPPGWHLPSDADWEELVNYCGGQITAASRMKKGGLPHWSPGPTSSIRETGFNAVPGGYRNANGIFGTVGYNGYWWSSTAAGNGSAWSRGMYDFYEKVSRIQCGTNEGLSVRCIRD